MKKIVYIILIICAFFASFYMHKKHIKNSQCKHSEASWVPTYVGKDKYVIYKCPKCKFSKFEKL